MVDKIGSGNKFDAAWKEAKQQLISGGNAKPTTQDILHYLIDKWKPQNNDSNKLVVQGFHLEHDSTPEINTKYGANIGCQQEIPEAVTKYGANIGCQQEMPEAVTKYGANIGCQVQADTIHMEIPQVVTKYGANIGCGDHTFKINNRELIDKIKVSFDKFNADSAVVYDRQTGTLHIKSRKSE